VKAINDSPLSITEVSDDYRNSLPDKIVGFRIPIDEIRGKYKLNQRSSRDDRVSIISGLNATGSESAAAVAKAMEKAGEP
jgi:transcriptional regulator